MSVTLHHRAWVLNLLLSPLRGAGRSDVYIVARHRAQQRPLERRSLRPGFIGEPDTRKEHRERQNVFPHRHRSGASGPSGRTRTANSNSNGSLIRQRIAKQTAASSKSATAKDHGNDTIILHPSDSSHCQSPPIFSRGHRPGASGPSGRAPIVNSDSNGFHTPANCLANGSFKQSSHSFRPWPRYNPSERLVSPSEPACLLPGAPSRRIWPFWVGTDREFGFERVSFVSELPGKRQLQARQPQTSNKFNETVTLRRSDRSPP